MESTAKHHIEVYRRKKKHQQQQQQQQQQYQPHSTASNFSTGGDSPKGASRAITDRMEKWEADKVQYSSEAQYLRARLEYLEDIIKLQRDTVERPLRRANSDLEIKIERLQNQLNIVAGQLDTQAKELAAAESRAEAAEQAARTLAVTERSERERIISVHEQHLAAERRANASDLDKLTTQLKSAENDLACSTSQAVSPQGISRTYQREEKIKLEAHNSELQKSVIEKEQTIDALQTRLRQVEDQVTISEDTEEHLKLLKVWEVLSKITHDTDRYKGGLRAAVAQMELGGIDRTSARPKGIVPAPPTSASLRKWVNSLLSLSESIADMVGEGRSYSVAILKKVLEAHQHALEVGNEKERSTSTMKALEKQRLNEVERDRDEERKLFARERERMKSEAGALRKSFNDLQVKAQRNQSTIDSDTQTMASFSQAATIYTQTAASSDPVLDQLKTDVEFKDAQIADLNLSIATRDASIYSLQEQRERFLNFIFDTRMVDDNAIGLHQRLEHASPKRPSELAQESTLEFLSR
eukprot:TRINITY_DN9307_c0_g1_i1.p1 TRINITY_DN9307_c0_g1~~TRINITY_DN9307_c0_g1_i1.p1  ORF type:complete len:553 (+),score=143.54 TRINITY_DN9307_c0_g1_i1:79-1659(+)